MNANDLPPAARLAALIETGRAAYPALRQSRCFFYGPNGDEACAMGFAMLAEGGVDLACRGPMSWFDKFGTLPGAIANMNDAGASIEEICQSLREGVLAKLAA